MTDELTARLRALEAERLRPVPPPPSPWTTADRYDNCACCNVLIQPNDPIRIEDDHRLCQYCGDITPARAISDVPTKGYL